MAEGDIVVTRWTAQGTHQGELFGIAATGRQATITGVSVERIVGGQIVEDHTKLGHVRAHAAARRRSRAGRGVDTI